MDQDSTINLILLLELLVDSSGNIYVADSYNHRVMKWAQVAQYREPLLLAEMAHGSGLDQLSYPYDVTVR